MGVKFFETGIVVKALFRVGDRREKNPAADYDQLFSGPCDDHIEAIGIIEKLRHDVVPVRGGEPEEDYVPFCALDALYRVDEGKGIPVGAKEIRKACGERVILCAMGRNDGDLIRFECRSG